MIDLAGAERYLKTTVSGLTSSQPDYAIVGPCFLVVVVVVVVVAVVVVIVVVVVGEKLLSWV